MTEHEEGSCGGPEYCWECLNHENANLKVALATSEAARVKAEQERDEAKKQLPAGMGGCTILFKECPLGHGWLTASNWVQHKCPTCELATLRESLRVKTEELAEAKRLERETATKCGNNLRAWLSEKALRENAEAALATSRAHHAYDCARKDTVLRDLQSCYKGALVAILEALTPSTPQEAEAWAREQKDGKEK